MFDVGWTEMLVIACVAIIVVGPKDLPKMLRAFGKSVASVKRMAGDFQRQFDDALRDAELSEVKDIATGKGFKPLEDAKASAAAFEKTVKEQMAAATKSAHEMLPEDKLPEPKALDTKPDVKPAIEPKKEIVAAKSLATSATKTAKPAKTAKKPTIKKSAKTAKTA